MNFLKKPTLALDIEVYSNYLLIGFKSIDTGKFRYYEMFNGSAFNREEVMAILRQHRIITFNGINYDMPVLTMALRGATNAELKAASNQIIEEGLRNWQFEQEYGFRVPEIDHIDLSEPVPGVKISLKLYGARLHSKRLQELPYEHTMIVTEEMRSNLVTYNENDLDTTIDLWLKATDPKDDIIHTRELMSQEFGLDLRSKSDAQIAEAAIKARVSQITGNPVYKPEVKPGTVYNYTPPAFIKFEHPALRAKLAEIVASPFVVNAKGKIDMPPALRADKKTKKKKADDHDDGEIISAPASSKVTINRTTYTMGIGGLHSTEKSKGHLGTKGVLLRDRDVVSYYPSLILQCGLFPKNMGAHFQKVYAEFFHKRIAAKKAGDKSTAQTLKIVLNGTFGKLGSKYSVLYSPDLLIQVTVTGQLALLMLIERMEAAGIPVVSANTDGIVMACPVNCESKMQKIVAHWERDTGLETEETKYRALFSRDVNNYIALKDGKGFKTKGVLTSPGIMKNPDCEIVSMAVAAQLDSGVPIAETILKCRDVRKFLRVKRVTGGGTYGGQYLGKVVRWYRRRGESRCITYLTNGNKVGGSDGAAPVMNLPDAVPADIDYGWYVAEAHDMLRELGAI